MVPELSRPVAADRIKAAGLEIEVEAVAEECTAIAYRLLIPSVESVRCRWMLRPASGGAIEAEGSLHARLQRECVVSLEPFATDVVEEFAVRFVPEGEESGTVDDPDEPDELPIVAGMLDLGEATVEQLALALDPYPRKPGAVLPEDAADVPDGVFAALAKLRRPE
jgi:hypothetical protein